MGDATEGPGAAGAVLALSDGALAGIVSGVLLVAFVVWAVGMSWLDTRRTRREEDAMRRHWRGLP